MPDAPPPGPQPALLLSVTGLLTSATFAATPTLFQASGSDFDGPVFAGSIVRTDPSVATLAGVAAWFATVSAGDAVLDLLPPFVGSQPAAWLDLQTRTALFGTPESITATEP